MLRVILSTIRHQKWRSLLMIFSSGMIVLVVCILSGLVQRQEVKLEELIRDTKINCIVTDSKGTNSENLGMLSFYVDMLTGRRHERGCYLDEVVTDVRALASQKLDSPEDFDLRRILSLDSDQLLSSGVRVQFFDGFDEMILRSVEDVCLIPEYMEPEGQGTLTVTSGTNRKTLKIIGTVSDGSTDGIWVPFYFKWEDNLSSAFPVQSCSFTIRSNARLEQTKDDIFTWFSRPSVSNGADAEPFGVLVQDQTYLESLNKLESSLELLRLLLPLLAVLGSLISFLATYAMTRGRQKEFAVMRCLGLRQRKIFSIVLLEQLVLILMGGSIGMCFGVLLGALIQAARICGVLLLYLLGTATAAMRITRINVMRLMKTED